MFLVITKILFIANLLIADAIWNAMAVALYKHNHTIHVFGQMTFLKHCAKPVAYVCFSISLNSEPIFAVLFERCIMVSLKISGNGRNCTNVNLCESNPCDQLCETLYNDYNCSCHTGYTLFNSTHCIDIDECAGDNQCSTTANAICQNTVGNYT